MENKRNTSKAKVKRNKGFPYKSRIPINVNQTQKYLVKSKDGEILGKYRLKSTCTQEHGRNVEIINLDVTNK